MGFVATDLVLNPRAAALSKPCRLAKLQLSHLQNGNSNTYFMDRCEERTHVKYGARKC